MATPILHQQYSFILTDSCYIIMSFDLFLSESRDLKDLMHDNPNYNL